MKVKFKSNKSRKLRRVDRPLTLSLFLGNDVALGSATVGSVFFSSPFLWVFWVVLNGLMMSVVLVGVNGSELFCWLASAKHQKSLEIILNLNKI